MSRRLLVTVADEKYLEPAQQLFACVHFDAGWSGDLMLLAHEVPEAKLVPFRERGILVRRVDAWREVEPGGYNASPVLSKFQVFAPAFREWDHILYLDGDMMFWGSLDRIVGRPGLWAVSDRTDLAWQLRGSGPHSVERLSELGRRYDLSREAFNSGLLAFSSDLIRDDTLDELRRLYLRYEGLRPYDQGVFNLYFYRRWRRVPDFYAAQRHVPARYFHVPKERFRTIGRHFVGYPRVWDEENSWHAEWKRSLARFEHLDARRPQPPARVWSGWEVRRYWFTLHLNRSLFPVLDLARRSWRRLRGLPAVKLVRRAFQRLSG